MLKTDHKVLIFLVVHEEQPRWVIKRVMDSWNRDEDEKAKRGAFYQTCCNHGMENPTSAFSEAVLRPKLWLQLRQESVSWWGMLRLSPRTLLTALGSQTRPMCRVMRFLAPGGPDLKPRWILKCHTLTSPTMCTAHSAGHCMNLDLSQKAWFHSKAN